MTPQQYDRAREVFLQVIECEPASRGGRLDLLCNGDASLRDAVVNLLDADRRANGFLDQPPSIASLVDEIADRTAAIARTPLIGKTVGRFHVTGVIASGGMGVVYQARQADPDRIVALKVLSGGAMSRDSISRFRHEVQILARLNHPGIAQVYEAGMHDDGSGAVPYFAMELVPDAMAITQFVKSNGLSIDQRLEMFARVCDAVHYGHQRGVIHRDIKPGNVLVSDAKRDQAAHTAQPKVIDFGVARSTGSDIQLTTIRTEIGQIVGTLQYMSPEQFDGNPDAIDTRTDVYALGLLMYELLAEQLPYHLDGLSIHAAAKCVHERNPPRLSTVHRVLRGDIELIACKAIEKSPDRRYASAAQLAEDVRRHLSHQPISVRAPGMATMVAGLVRRNRRSLQAASIGGVLAAMLAAALVLVLVLFPIWAARAADRARLALIDPAYGNDIYTDVFLKTPVELNTPTQQSQLRRRHSAGLADYDLAVRYAPFDDQLRIERDVVSLADNMAERSFSQAQFTPFLQAHAPLTCAYARQRVAALVLPVPSLEHAINADLRALGLFAALTRDTRTAIDAWSRLDATTDGDSLVDAWLGLIFIANDEPARAYPRLRAACQAYPEHSLLSMHAAEAAARCGDPEKARFLLNRARELPGHDVMGGIDRVEALILVAEHRDDEARAAYEHLCAEVRYNTVRGTDYLRFLEARNDWRRAGEVAGFVSGMCTNMKLLKQAVGLTEQWWSRLTPDERLCCLMAMLAPCGEHLPNRVGRHWALYYAIGLQALVQQGVCSTPIEWLLPEEVIKDVSLDRLTLPMFVRRIDATGTAWSDSVSDCIPELHDAWSRKLIREVDQGGATLAAFLDAQRRKDEK